MPGKRTRVELSKFLTARGVTHTGAKKARLEELAEKAEELCLPILATPTLTEFERDNDRRLIECGDKTISLPHVQTISSWDDDLSLLPSLNNGMLIIFLMNEADWPEQDINELEKSHAFQLHENGHIHDVVMHAIADQPYIYVRGKCVRETSLGEQPYAVWALLQNDGPIKSAACECTGDDGYCKHAVCFLIGLVKFIEDSTNRDNTTCTSSPCVWVQPRKTSEPQEIDDIDIRHRKTSALRKKPIPSQYIPCPMPALTHQELEKQMKCLFKDSNAVLNTVYGDSSSESCDDESDIQFEIPSMTDFGHQYTGQKNDNITFEKFIKKECNRHIRNEIEIKTRDQANSDSTLWHNQRQYRITSSVSHRAFKTGKKVSCKSLMKDITGESSGFDCEALRYGRKNEVIARQIYAAKYKKEHRNAKVRKSGLAICSEAPYIAASPDGIVTCKCCGQGLLEIKCTFKYKDLSPIDVCNQKGYKLTVENGKLNLKKTSDWYSQIQHQLLVTRKPWCDFVLYTQRSPFIETQRIFPDEEWQKSAMTRFSDFFSVNIMPALLSD